MAIAEMSCETDSVADICKRLQGRQKQRAWYLKSRNMIATRLQATVAGTLGYCTKMSEKERQGKFQEARRLIAGVVNEEIKAKRMGRDPEHVAAVQDVLGIILNSMIAVNGFDRAKREQEVYMRDYAELLPVSEWVKEKEQRGFGILFLAIIIGEAGDLLDYSSPAKLWRRFGCAPYTKDGLTLMGKTWRTRSNSRTEKKLTAKDWEEFGYNPRRRSIAYLVGEGLLKQNQMKEDGKVVWRGPYRLRYDEAKAQFAERHPEYSDGRCHNHGMLLASKRLLLNLWKEWNRWNH